MEKRLNTRSLSPKKGIIGIAQHSDLFWEKTADDIIHRILDIVEEVGTAKMAKGDGTKYVLWSKRAERMASFLTTRYPEKLPPCLACGVSIENQEMADRRLPHLLWIPGYRFIMIKPMVGPVDLRAFLDVHWVVTGSETGGSDAAPLVLDWVRDLRDLVTPRGIPFFIKQLGNNHKNPQRVLDGRTWDEFPAGFVK